MQAARGGDRGDGSRNQGSNHRRPQMLPGVVQVAARVATAVPADPESLIHYLRWLAKGTNTRPAAKPATLARRLASIARVHRILGFDDKELLPTQAGMVRDTLKAIGRQNLTRQRQAAPLRLGEAMAEGQGAPQGVTIQALLASCGSDVVDLRDAALISLAYDAGFRASELWPPRLLISGSSAMVAAVPKSGIPKLTRWGRGPRSGCQPRPWRG